MLDEPLAALDPVAREDFMASVVEAAREDDISVVLSSHVLAELERVATYLIVLAGGQVQVAGSVKDLLASHGAGLEEIALRHLRAGVATTSGTDAGDEHRNHDRQRGDDRRPASGALAEHRLGDAAAAARRHDRRVRPARASSPSTC